MNYQEFEGNFCRICLQEDVIVDWNEYLQENDHLTYKDCYYKYTQLDCFDRENLYLSTMLCCNCTKSLENINAFITTAVETHNILQEHLALNIECEEENKKDLNINFETVLFTETDIEMKSELQNVTLYESTSIESLNIDRDSESIAEGEFLLNHDHMYGRTSIECRNEDKNTKAENSSTPVKQSEVILSMKEKCEKDDIKKPSDELESDIAITKKSEYSKKWRIPTCCSICSRVLISKYAAAEHEQTHTKNRERNEICTKCGMKFYNKSSLRGHMKTHIENREKSHKCEYCDKAFYNRGDLKIHHRIHLGQKIKCNLCTKVYYRQVDLDKHLRSHSATKISDDLKPNKKYFVHCEVCDITIRSNQYKSHSAKHMNEPLTKCAICDKEFFSRKSCSRHLKNFHKKGSGERSKFIVAYETTRYSNLFLQQNVGTIFTEE